MGCVDSTLPANQRLHQGGPNLRTPQAANGMFATTRNGSRGSGRRSTSASITSTNADPAKRSRRRATQTGSISTAKTRRARRAELRCENAVTGSDLEHEVAASDLRLPGELGGDGATSEEVLAVGATAAVAQRAGAARAHGRPPRTSLLESSPHRHLAGA